MSAIPNKYNEVKYGERKYGLNIQAEDICPINDAHVAKIDGKIVVLIWDVVGIEESLSRKVDYKKSLSDSLEINEIVGVSRWGDLDESVPISESVGNGISLNLSDSLGDIDTSINITIAEGITLKTSWKFYIRDDSGYTVASLVNARGRWFKEALNQGGSAGFILDTTDTNCSEDILKINKHELVIVYKGFEMYGGQISSINKVASGNDRYWEITTKQFFNLLEQRYCGYNKSTGLSDIREFTTTDAGTIAWTLINESQNEVNGDLGITQGTIQSSLL